MGRSTAIEWTDATWNPVRGCSRISPGCVHCYAERQAARFARAGRLTSIGSVNPCAPSVPAGPFSGFVQLTNGHPQWTGRVELIEAKLAEPQHWRDPRRIFVNSMSDLFHEALSDDQIAHVFRTMYHVNWHTYQVLTKRSARMRDLMPRLVETFGVMPHVWRGVSVESEQYAGRIGDLFETAAAVRFVSYEPALAPVDFSKWLCGCNVDNGPFEGMCNGRHGLSWIIVGGESGPGARPFDTAWARNTIRQCRNAGVACFVKQLGADPLWAPETILHLPRRCDMKLRDSKGGDWNEWPADLRVREFPQKAAA